ncbi:hypothetical protein B0I33_102232 [Prauserella shujinwangii]|uniref:Secreted protein n=1 Tax=Prauserella shujinwangii TaxID=1453103 RepID=A0A2T0M0J1_9PSEU|nr:hypothetical protein [Prauserella shujinwangii]PRX50114.1 hypothetical protein B0I33_102232 [Prauserella shujinwangii]
MPQVGDLAVNLLASVIAGVSVLLAQFLRRRRGEARKRAFFGLATRSTCAVFVPRHARSDSVLSVHRSDAAAIVELAAAARDCGAEVELVPDASEHLSRTLGGRTEFSVGSPVANPRTGALLETFVPGLTIGPHEDSPDRLTISADGHAFGPNPGRREYVALAKVTTEDYPIFVLCGQTAVSNHAAARYLARGYRRLIREYGVTGRFCLVLGVVNSKAFGERNVEVVGDLTEVAFLGHRASA